MSRNDDDTTTAASLPMHGVGRIHSPDNVPQSGSSDSSRHVLHQVKFATKITRSPCIGATRSASDGMAPIQPRDVHVWAVTRAATAHDPRADFGERSDLPSSGNSTPLANCFPAGLPLLARPTSTSIPVPIPEEGGTGLNRSSPVYVNFPCLVDQEFSSDSDTTASAPADCPSRPQQFYFSVNGELYCGETANQTDSGVPESDAETSNNHRVMKFARVRPNCVKVGMPSAIAISLPEENGMCLEAGTCVVQYWKPNGQQPEFVTSGKKGMNKYDIEAYSPCFETVGERIVQILTEAETCLLAVARLNVIAQTADSRYNIFVISSSDNSVTDPTGQVVRVLSNKAGPTAGSYQPLVCGSLHCLGGSENETAEFAHGLLDFALDGICGGLPPPLSLRHLLAALPNLQGILESYHLAAGSLQHLLEVVRHQCGQQSVVQDIEMLVEQAMANADDDDENLSSSSVNMESQCHEREPSTDRQHLSSRLSRSLGHIYDEVSNFKDGRSCVTPVAHSYAIPGENIEPQNTGLAWPSKMGNVSEKVRIRLLTQVRDGDITMNKAIEKTRDYTYAPKPMSAPTSPAMSKRRKKTRKEPRPLSSRTSWFDFLRRKPTSPVTSNKHASESQSGLSTDSMDKESHQQQRRNKKIRPEAEKQQIRRKLSASSGDTLTGETSSVGTGGTVGTISLTSESSNEQKQADDQTTTTTGKASRQHRISSDSGIADVALQPPNQSWDDCFAELKQKLQGSRQCCQELPL